MLMGLKELQQLSRLVLEVVQEELQLYHQDNRLLFMLVVKMVIMVVVVESVERMVVVYLVFIFLVVYL